MSTVAQTAGLVVLAVVVVFTVSEWWLRRRVWRRNAGNFQLWWTVMYGQEGNGAGDPPALLTRCPGVNMSFRLYGYEAQPLVTADLGLNNLGFISTRDYRYERGPNEFRIVVIGGEQTASTVASKSWPDFLEDELNRRDPSVHYRVFNIGWPDAGPEHYVQYWQGEGVKFSPDLVIVNYVENDFHRALTGTAHKYRGHPITLREMRFRVGPGPDDIALTMVAATQGSPADSLRDPRVLPSRPYGFYVSRGFANDPPRVRALQRQVVRDMVRGALPPFGALTVRRLTRRSADIDVTRIRTFDPLPAQAPDRARMVQFGLSTFGWLARHVPNLILTHNFDYWGIKYDEPFELTEAMQAADPHIRVLDMRRRIPPDVTDEELKSWSIVPYMAEKWSLRGHEAYAELMAGVVMDWRAGTLDLTSDRSCRGAS